MNRISSAKSKTKFLPILILVVAGCTAPAEGAPSSPATGGKADTGGIVIPMGSLAEGRKGNEGMRGSEVHRWEVDEAARRVTIRVEAESFVPQLKVEYLAPSEHRCGESQSIRHLETDYGELLQRAGESAYEATFEFGDAQIGEAFAVQVRARGGEAEDGLYTIQFWESEDAVRLIDYREAHDTTLRDPEDKQACPPCTYPAPRGGCYPL